MQSTSYAVPAGHALRLALSPTYWPWIWPSPEPVTLTATGATARAAGAPRAPHDAGLQPFGAPETRARADGGARARRHGRADRPRATSRRAREATFPWIDRRPRWTDARPARRAQRRPLPAGRGRPALGEGRCEVEVELARGEWRTAASQAAGQMTCDGAAPSSSPRGSTRYEGADARPRARLDARDPAGRRMRAGRSRGAGTRTPRSRAASATGSSCAAGSTPAARPS